MITYWSHTDEAVRDSTYVVENPKSDKHVYEPRAKRWREELSPPLASKY